MSAPAASGPPYCGFQRRQSLGSPKAPIAYIIYLLQLFLLFSPMGNHPYLLNYFLSDASSCL